MLKRLILSLAVLAVLLPLSRSRAEVYRYTDDKGGLHYVNNLSLVPEKYRGQLKDANPLPQISIISPRERFVRSDTGLYDEHKKKIEVYVTSWCPYCKKLEAFLNSKGIAYTRYDIEKDANAKKVFKQLGGGGVPLTIAGSEKIHGYDPDAIMEFIK